MEKCTVNLTEYHCATAGKKLINNSNFCENLPFILESDVVVLQEEPLLALYGIFFLSACDETISS